MATPDLRPLSFGELLDRVFTVYRKNFWLFVGIMAIPQVFIVGVTVIMQSFQMTVARARPGATPDVGFLLGYVAAMGLLVITYTVVHSIALGATTFAVSDVYLGKATTVRDSYRRLKGRIGSFFALFFMIWLRAVAWLMTIILSPMIIRVFLMYSLATPALFLEGVSASEAMKRSRVLTKGRFGQIFLIGLLTSAISWAVAALVQGPFYIAIGVMAAQKVQAPFWLLTVIDTVGGAAGACVQPLFIISLALLYYDIRVRQEGYDLQLMVDALGPAGSTPAPAQGFTA